MHTKAAQVYGFIVQYKEQNDGLSPTIDDITETCGFSSKSITYHHLRMLCKAGLLTAVTSGRGRVRGWKVSGATWKAPHNDA